MRHKPSYLGLLNAIAVAEAQAHEYLHVWADATPSEDVRKVLLTVAAREGEHGMSFAKRINELGYEVRCKDDSGLTEGDGDREVGLLGSREDEGAQAQQARHRRQARHLRRPLQGSLDRHPHRRAARALHRRGARHRPPAAQLLRPARRASKSKSPPPAADSLGSLEAKVDTLCRAVEELRQIVCAQAMPTTAA